MTYTFLGFFIQDFNKDQINLHELKLIDGEAVCKEIKKPFYGSGIRLSNRFSKNNNNLTKNKLLDLSTRLGLEKEKWIFLDYQCWGGMIDSVVGLVHKDTEFFDPLSSDHHGTAEDIYLELMAQFGITKEDAMNFAPFYRNFWGTY